jgi:putative transposase
VRCFLTFCTAQRHSLFTEASTVNLVLSHFLHTAAETDVAILAYCFMPDHTHLLVQGLDDSADVERFAHLGKQRSGYEFAVLGGARLWQPSYFDRLLRSDEDTWSVIRYIVENPVRAGLVEEPRRFAFSGSGVYSLDALIEGACAPGIRSWAREG